ncbi:MAG TPA: tRNA (adenosine(37)-N6)-threonylcarbamoyltransferase complex transferase subunit TsaD [Terriglobia bacterium]|nr:tRNA (adenosine(37)-N6)-threonylcarbamoyltransferase complex transferase subunit TsaD [Terriglobia bacterium]
MVILGIESSCDETAAAVVVDGERVLSNVIASQVLTHAKYGGVVPELASREHLKRIVFVVEEACRQAEASLRDMEAIAVTEGPGLVGSLLVGLVYSKALAFALGTPLIGVNHLEGHIQSVLLQNKIALRDGSEVDEAMLPTVALVVSGGHTSLYLVQQQAVNENNRPGVFSYSQLGQTRDDAAGEAFDKVAKLLALGYPGGPIIDRLSAFGNSKAFEFGRIRMKRNPLDFSFSGLKTAVLQRLRGTPLEAEAGERRRWRPNAGQVTTEEIRARCSEATLNLIASFQHAVISDLTERTLAAADDQNVQSILVSGGVACNSLLRKSFHEAVKQRGLKVFFPTPVLSTDNAAMIAAAGYYRIAAGYRSNISLTAHASFPLGASGL